MGVPKAVRKELPRVVQQVDLKGLRMVDPRAVHWDVMKADPMGDCLVEPMVATKAARKVFQLAAATAVEWGDL